MDAEIKEDLEKAKEYISINEVQVIDDKITANFCYHEKPNPMECCSNWISYKKVFDTWTDFSDYADKFFNSINASDEA
jgi:hypothetical protein